MLLVILDTVKFVFVDSQFESVGRAGLAGGIAANTGTATCSDASAGSRRWRDGGAENIAGESHLIP